MALNYIEQTWISWSQTWTYCSPLKVKGQHCWWHMTGIHYRIFFHRVYIFISACQLAALS